MISWICRPSKKTLANLKQLVKCPVYAGWRSRQNCKGPQFSQANQDIYRDTASVYRLNRNNGLEIQAGHTRNISAHKNPGVKELSNRDGPPPEISTAAPALTGNGGNGKLPSKSELESYRILALSARFPIIAEHVGFDDMEVLI